MRWEILKAESGKRKADSRVATQRKAPCSRAVPSVGRRMAVGRRLGMTLIELLVVIIILTTLVGGVLPVLSPNNDARKIRQAARGLQTFIMQAQTQAARTGRPAGIAFRESSPGSGVALEVYQIEVPPPFAGFSQYSAARVEQNEDDPSVMRMQFVLTNSLVTPVELNEDTREPIHEYRDIEQLPPKFVRPNDIVINGRIAFRLLKPAGADLTDDEGFYDREKIFGADEEGWIPCELVDDSQTLPTFEHNPKNPPFRVTPARGYQILRQPAKVTSGATEPYQLPAGVCIDLQASGTEGGATPTLFARGPDYPNDPPTALKQVGLLFTPSGSVDRIFFEGYLFGPDHYEFDSFQEREAARITSITDASRICLLLARVENGGVDVENRQDLQGPPAWRLLPAPTREELAEKRERINWLNPDSRWMVIDARDGRTIVAENAFVGSQDMQDIQEARDGKSISDKESVFLQAQLARELAREMQRGGGR